MTIIKSALEHFAVQQESFRETLYHRDGERPLPHRGWLSRYDSKKKVKRKDIVPDRYSPRPDSSLPNRGPGKVGQLKEQLRDPKDTLSAFAVLKSTFFGDK